ncbi:MAG TPA: hypothetical protein VL425_10425, partial [Rudaea sp.]|nr:hypothetical protein [Rudaea sp.]
MTFLLMLVGAALGAFFCAGVFEEPTGWTAAVLGGCIGLLLGQLRTLRRRLTDVEKSLGALRVEAALQGARLAEPARDAPTSAPAPAPQPSSESVPMPVSVPPAPAIAEYRAPALVIPERVPPEPQIPAPPAPPDFIAQSIDRAKRWFTEGNVPVKVGIVVSFFGVGALLKYAADSGWLV